MTKSLDHKPLELELVGEITEGSPSGGVLIFSLEHDWENDWDSEDEDWDEED